MIAELFGVEVPVISKHLANIFESGELKENSAISILETTASDGKTYKTSFYNLDAIIAVGYRVNPQKATQFRIWATQVLKTTFHQAQASGLKRDFRSVPHRSAFSPLVVFVI